MFTLKLLNCFGKQVQEKQKYINTGNSSVHIHLLDSLLTFLFLFLPTVNCELHLSKYNANGERFQLNIKQKHKVNSFLYVLDQADFGSGI